jgi:hypothetical protein
VGVVPNDQVRARGEGGLRHGFLIIGDQARHEVNAPMQRQHDRVGLLLRGSHVRDQVGLM